MYDARREREKERKKERGARQAVCNDKGALMDSSGRGSIDATTEALATLSEYLERSLDAGASLILVRSRSEKSDVYLGDASEAQTDWRRCGVIQNAMVGKILEATNSGFNELTIGNQTYRFNRSFTQVADHGAVVFSPS